MDNSVKISDFECAGSISHSKIYKSSPEWRFKSPEVIEHEGNASEASDIWSFGVMLYELFSRGEGKNYR